VRPGDARGGQDHIRHHVGGPAKISPAELVYNQFREIEMNIHEPAAEYIVDKKGRKKGVLLSLDHYEQLMEDLHDLTVIAGRKSEKTVPFLKTPKHQRKNGRL
jgi:PHD/YefM family antitoxin component YafN of YafNO toxin-antitoxin module